MILEQLKLRNFCLFRGNQGFYLQPVYSYGRNRAAPSSRSCWVCAVVHKDRSMEAMMLTRSMQLYYNGSGVLIAVNARPGARRR
jgi:hypothetical protein